MSEKLAQGFITITDTYETAMVKLTNEMVAIPCDSFGTPKPQAYLGASTFIEVFRGNDKINSSDVIIGELILSSGTKAEVRRNQVLITSVEEMSGYVDIPIDIRIKEEGVYLGVYRFGYTKQLDGASGETTYTWIRYADTQAGEGISNSPIGKKYIGFAYNKTSKTESEIPSDYKWSLIKGEAGVPGPPGTNTYTWIKYSSVLAPTQSNQIYDIPNSSTISIGIAVNKTDPTESTTPGEYTWSKFKGDDGVPGADGRPGVDGKPGADGTAYTIKIIEGVRGIAYAANGTNPDPSGSTTYKVQFHKNGVAITSGASYTWNCGGCLIKPSTTNSAQFSPTISGTYSKDSSFVSISIAYAGSTFTDMVPIVCTKHADGLDWINDWNNTSVVVGTNRIIAPRIFAGTKNSSNQLTGVALGKDVISGNLNNIVGLVGYKNNTPVFSLDQNADFFVSSSGNANAVKEGDANGLYFDGSNFYVTGSMKIQSNSTIGKDGKSVEEVLGDIGTAQATASSASSVADKALSDINDITLEVDGNTLIRGNLIASGTITGEAINAGSFTIKDSNGHETFKIDANGNTHVNGVLQSTIFNEAQNMGYRITPDGKAILNQARVSGEFIMPNAGITNYGAGIGNQNLLTGTSGFEKTFNTNQHYTNLGTRTLAELGVKVDETITFRVYLSPSAGADKGVRARISYYNNPADDSKYGTVQSETTIVKGDSGYSSLTFKIPTNTTKLIFAIQNGDTGITTGVQGTYKEAKVEKSSTATPWCPHKTEQSNYTRIWAGSNYEGRDRAPFRVLQSGDVWATNATLSGRLIGDYDNGLIHIHNNQIVINSTETAMTPLGVITNTRSRDYKPQPHIVLSPGQSLINTDLVFGTTDDKKIEYLNKTKKLYLNDVGFKSNSAASNSSIEINNISASNHFDGVVLRGNAGGVHSIGYENNYSSLKFESRGSATHSSGNNYDFAFEGIGPRASNVELRIDGSATVNKAIKSGNHNIEMRGIKGEGWGFYVV